MNKHIFLFPLVTLLLPGCTVDGKLAEENSNKIVTCKDLRDGEVFAYNNSTITNVRIGFGAPTTIDIITLSGQKKTLSSEMTAWIKCE